jgi:hypothetical protein
MNKLSKIAAFIFFPISVIAAEPTHSHLDNQGLTPAPQIEPGKLKRVSKDQLSPELKKMVEGDLENANKGYEIVPEDFFTYSGNYHNRLRQEDEIKPNLRVALADIKVTELSSYIYEGIIPEGPTLKGPWTSVIRVFKREDDVTVMLGEWDFVADGGGVVTVNELMNTTVGSFPAMLTVKKSPSGRVLTELAWSTNEKYFTITVWDDIDNKRLGKEFNRKWLLNLANSLM